MGLPVSQAVGIKELAAVYNASALVISPEPIRTGTAGVTHPDGSRMHGNVIKIYVFHSEDRNVLGWQLGALSSPRLCEFPRMDWRVFQIRLLSSEIEPLTFIAWEKFTNQHTWLLTSLKRGDGVLPPGDAGK